jgi:glycosyltransferase involved in cell wall biosynthesis
VVPAYLESGVIGSKVRNTLAHGYPGTLEVLVVADGDPETAEVARAAGARVLALSQRRGKSQAINAGVAAANHELIVLTDANSRLVDGAVAYLVRWLLAPGVGAVAGEKLEGAGGELAYWRFESWIKRNEARLGSTIGLDGALCGVRRSIWRPIPADVSTDDLWIALDVMESGHRVAYEPRAVVLEESIGDLSLSWERRTRIVGAGLWVLWRKRRLLDPRAGLVSAEVWGHRAWRYTGGPLSHLALLALAVRSARRSRVSQSFLVGHAVAAVGIGAQARGAWLPMPIRVGAQVLFLQAVAFGGLLRFLQRDRALTWKKPAR